MLETARPVRSLAAGHPSVVTDDVRQLCAQLGVDVLPVDDGPNAADRALLAAALQLYAIGVTTWYVASCDGVFSALPGTLTVLVTGGAQPSLALVQRAANIRRVGRPPTEYAACDACADGLMGTVRGAGL
jgi:hypothetical protein